MQGVDAYECVQRFEWYSMYGESLAHDGCVAWRMGFRGMVVSDYTSVQELINHRVAVSRTDAGILALSAGVRHRHGQQHLCSRIGRCRAIAQTPEDVVDIAVRRVLRTKLHTGSLTIRTGTVMCGGRRQKFSPKRMLRWHVNLLASNRPSKKWKKYSAIAARCADDCIDRTACR